MEAIFLGCVLVGFLMVVASALLGFAHLALPGGHDGFHLGHDGDAYVGHDGGVHAAAHGATHGPGHVSAGDGHGGDVSGGNGGVLPLWNVSSLLAFLMWFGAAGYVAMRFAGLSAWLALVPAVGFGVAGGLLVSAFLGFVLRGESWMKPADYELEGTLARVTVGLPAGGTGEIVFTKGDRRRVEGARSLDGTPVARGEEVVVVDYQRGLALVQSWEAFTRSASPPPSLAREGEELGQRPG
jgi:membrane protein implicated in regulation of membrane protease activity